ARSSTGAPPPTPPRIASTRGSTPTGSPRSCSPPTLTHDRPRAWRPLGRLAPAVAQQHMTDDQHNDKNPQCGEGIALVAVDLVIDRTNVSACQVAEAGPDSDPQRRTKNVER